MIKGKTRYCTTSFILSLPNYIVIGNTSIVGIILQYYIYHLCETNHHVFPAQRRFTHIRVFASPVVIIMAPGCGKRYAVAVCKQKAPSVVNT